MTYTLTQEEFDNLAGNKEKLIAELNKKLKDRVDEFSAELSNIILKHKLPINNDIYCTNAPVNALVEAIKLAMRNCKLDINKEEIKK